MDHDRLFKELITTFFFEFIELFFPQVAEYLDRSHAEFLDKELFTDVTAGDRHEADVVAKVRFRDREAFFLIHVEHQSSSQAGFAQRMFRYFARLHEKHGLPVYPIALFSYDAPQRAEPCAYRMEFPDRVVLAFNYATVQLNRLNWRDYLRNPNPLAAAVMAKMKIAPQDRPRVKLECLRLMATFRLNEAKMQLIWGFVESYLRLTASEQQRFQQAFAEIMPPEKEAIMQLPNTWIEQGIEQGEARGKRRMALLMLSRRFGELPESLRNAVEGLSSSSLEELAGAFLDFTSLDDAQRWIVNRA